MFAAHEFLGGRAGLGMPCCVALRELSTARHAMVKLPLWSRGFAPGLRSSVLRSSGLRSSGLALGLRRRRHLLLLQGYKYRVLLSSKVLLTSIPASKCSSSTCRLSEICSEY
jgi:hypothetical protein